MNSGKKTVSEVKLNTFFFFFTSVLCGQEAC